MTPTDVAGWIALLPLAIVLCAVAGGAAWLLEETERGWRLTDRLIALVVR